MEKRSLISPSLSSRLGDLWLLRTVSKQTSNVSTKNFIEARNSRIRLCFPLSPIRSRGRIIQVTIGNYHGIDDVRRKSLQYLNNTGAVDLREASDSGRQEHRMALRGKANEKAATNRNPI